LEYLFQAMNKIYRIFTKMFRSYILALAISPFIFSSAWGEIPTEQIGQFGNYGIVGAIVIILGFVLWSREKEWTKRQMAWELERAKNSEDRLKDFTGLMELMKDTNITNAQSNLISTERTAAVNGVATALNLHTAMIQRLIDAFAESSEQMRETITKAAESNRQLREALISDGLKPNQR
jgi:hypothetical protein